MDLVTFTTDDGVTLQGELRLPEGTPRGVAVLCHPHPRHGGSKDHPLLWAIRNHLAAGREMAVLGFNFRGVMESGGTYGGGRDELRDVRAAIAWLRERATGPGAGAMPTLLVGWSFGASVALREALDDPRVGAIALVGLPVRPNDLSLPDLPDPADLGLFRRPALLVAGEHDDYCPPDELREFGARFPDARLEILEGTDHYFWRREKDVAELIGAFAETALPLG
jgi:alpha/beta superfamily hydrolase